MKLQNEVKNRKKASPESYKPLDQMKYLEMNNEKSARKKNRSSDHYYESRYFRNNDLCFISQIDF